VSDRHVAIELINRISRRGIKFADAKVGEMPSLEEHTLIIRALKRMVDEKPPKPTSRLRIWPWGTEGDDHDQR
jgi:hypothetical protein